MSLPITVPATDYVSGSVKISTTRFQADDLTTVITEWEQYYIKVLLDDLMYTEIRDNVTLHSKYTALIDGVTWVDDQSTPKTHVLRGLKEALRRFCYWHYQRDYFLNTVIGDARNLNENATNLTPSEQTQYNNLRYYEGVDIYDQCRAFVDFYEKITGSITSSVESPAGTYTISTPSTLYLEDGDTITLEGVDYVVGTVIANTSFVISGDAGLTFGDSYIYQPFFEPNLTKLDLPWL